MGTSTVFPNYLTTAIVTGKADKVASATSGNFAGLDANGNLTDSGHKNTDYVQRVTTLTAGTDLNTVVTSGFYRLVTGHTNAPANADYSQMIVSRGNDTIFQIVGIWGLGKVYTRTGNNIGASTAAFTDWTELTNSVTKNAADQWINSAGGVTALGVANNQNGNYASICADSEGGNIKVCKAGKYAEFDTFGMQTDGSGYTRIVVENASSYKTFKFQQDGNFVDGNNLSLGGLNYSKAEEHTVAIVQKGATATRNISKGQYVVWNGSLYIASTNIANGDTLSTSTNLTLYNDGGLNALASNFTLKSYSGTTGTTAFQGMYYGDTDISSDMSTYGTPVSFYVANTGNNHPAYAQRLTTSIRVYTPTTERTFTLYVLYAKYITTV